MTDAAVLGLPLEAAGDLGQPLAALVIVKCFSEDSEVGVSYSVRATGGLSTVECTGMAHLAVLRLTEALAADEDD